MSGTTEKPPPQPEPPPAPSHAEEERNRRARIKAWLARPRSARWIVALGIALTATSLGGGLSADDYLHAVTLLHLPFTTAHESSLDLFRFANGDPRTAHTLMDVGEFVWSTDPTVRFAFFRPLTALTHIFDYWAWPHTPALMHAQSLAWFAAVLAGAAAIYRRFLGATWIAGLALLLYALDDTHGPVVGWIANRNALIALAFSLAALWMHDRWRRDGWNRGAWGAPILLAAALLAGESALAIVAYLGAYTLHIERAPWRARLLAFAPYAAVVLVWRWVYTHFGFGVTGSGVYLDPGHDLHAFVAALPRRFPFLLVGQIGLPRSDFAEIYEYISPAAMGWMTVYSFVFLALFAAAIVPLWRRDPVTRFFVTGLVGATFPICGAFPSDRLLLFVGIGAMGLIAQLVAYATSFGQRTFAALLLFVHLALAPPLLAFRSWIIDYQAPTDVALRTLPSSPEIRSKTVVLVNPPNDLFQVYISVVRAVRGEPYPAHLWGLANVVTAMEVTRVDDRSLAIRPSQGFMDQEGDRMLRDPRNPLPVGAEVHLSGMTAKVLEVMPDRRPALVLFRFDAPLEDSKFEWFCWTREGYAPWHLPAVGERVRMPAHDFRRFILDISDRISEKLSGT